MMTEKAPKLKCGGVYPLAETDAFLMCSALAKAGCGGSGKPLPACQTRAARGIHEKKKHPQGVLFPAKTENLAFPAQGF